MDTKFLDDFEELTEKPQKTFIKKSMWIVSEIKELAEDSFQKAENSPVGISKPITTELFANLYKGEKVMKYPLYALALQIRKLYPAIDKRKIKTDGNKSNEISGNLIFLK